MTDLISRADAIEAVKETKPIVRSTERNCGKMIAEQHSKELVKALKALPSADALLQQEIDFHKKVSRIEAEKVVDLEHQLADMVSVVRCKDCRWYKYDSYCSKTEAREIDADNFCSYGERRKNV